MSNRNYPTIHYLPNIINSGSVYIDKTQFVVPLLENIANPAFFLSRPRRFGKSMFVSTLEQVFLGKKELFKGLYIYDKIQWETYPVIRFSMDKIGFTEAGLPLALMTAVKDIANLHNIHLENQYPSLCFQELIRALSKKYQKGVVVLIDEYDKPIIQYIERDSTEQAEINRDILKTFYGILKDNGEFLRFTFITGVSRFSKVSIFSDLNYLDDLTLDTNFATMCGFTEKEVVQYCYTGLEDLAAKENTTIEAIMDKIRFWYDGFSWNGKDFLYNPYSTMLLMKKQDFVNYWFDSGTPTFLVKLMNKDHKYIFENMRVSKDDYDWHDLKNLNYISIMLQTGYLTFKEDLGNGYFKASYPNKEVEKAFSKLLLQGYTYGPSVSMSQTLYDVENCLEKHDLEGLIKIVENMFKTLPSHFFQEEYEITDRQGNKKMIRKAVGESFYHAIIYLIFNTLGVHMNVEVAAREGRIDAVVETPTHIYLFEFKKDRSAKTALKQITDNHYPDRFALSKKPIFLIGISFSLQKRGINDYLIEPYPSVF